MNIQSTLSYQCRHPRAPLLELLLVRLCHSLPQSCLVLLRQGPSSRPSRHRAQRLSFADGLSWQVSRRHLCLCHRARSLPCELPVCVLPLHDEDQATVCGHLQAHNDLCAPATSWQSVSPMSRDWRYVVGYVHRQFGRKGCAQLPHGHHERRRCALMAQWGRETT